MDNNEFHTVRGYQLLEQNKRLLTSAMEDYLEMICRNSAQYGYLRINKLAALLNVKASSASKMVQKLGELEMLKYEKYGIVVLTDSGKEIGEFLLRRHRIIEEFLKNIGIGENLLVETELIEHNVSSSTLKCIEILNMFFYENDSLNKEFELFKSKHLNAED
jgi:Mn-dependent DtxR family transcriptional regulator